MSPHPLYHSFLKGGEIAGSIAAIGTVAGYLIRSAWNAGKGVVTANRNLTLMMTNHLPHIQGAIETVQRGQTQMSGDISFLKIKTADAIKSVDTLHDAFLRHLENGSRESIQIETRRVTLAKESNARITKLEDAVDPRLMTLEELGVETNPDKKPDTQA